MDQNKRKSNNESVKKSREKKKKTIEEKEEMLAKLTMETAELEQFLKAKRLEAAKIQQAMFNSGTAKDFTFVQNDKATIKKFDLKTGKKPGANC